MNLPSDLPALPAGIAQALGLLEGMCGLLACADLQKWDSLARPEPAHLAALVRAAHAELEAELSQHFTPPSTP